VWGSRKAANASRKVARQKDFLSRHFGALSRREKSRKTSGTRVDVCLHGKKKIIDYYLSNIIKNWFIG